MSNVKNFFAAAFVASGVAAFAGADTIAVTEFINNAIGEDDGREWVELYNYGNDDINLLDWVARDRDIDSFTFGDVTIAAGDFIILVGGSSSLTGAEKKTRFETEWLGGVADDRVIGIDGSWAIGNAEDEIVIVNPDGVEVWVAAYGNDESDGQTTFLTVDDYTVNVFGDKGDPGIVREGFDNGTSDFLGYESQDSLNATDPNAYSSLNGDFGSPFFIVGGGTPVFTLEFSGSCPGSGTFTISNATPNGNVALVYGFGDGPTTIPSTFPCAGTVLNVGNPNLNNRVIQADANGDAVFTTNLPAAACGAVRVQALDVATCDTSEVVRP